MVKAKQRKDGRWRASVYIGKNEYDKKIYKDIYGATEKECNEKIIDFLYKLNNNLIEKPKKNSNTTFEELFDNWLDNRIDIKETTRENYLSIKKCHLTPLLNLKANKITNSLIKKFYKELYDKRGPKLVKKVASKLNAFLHEMALNPNSGISRDILDGFQMPKTIKYRPYFVSDKDFKIIIKNLEKQYNNVESNIKYLYILLVVAGGCGLRISEALSLTTDDIDFTNSIITINKQQFRVKDVGYCIEKSLKTDDGERKIIMIPYVQKVLKEHIALIQKENEQVTKLVKNFKFKKIPVYDNEQIVDYIDSSKLLIRTNKFTMVPKNSAERSWKFFRENLGYTDIVRIHDFRRYFATLLMRRNIPDKIATKLMGHSEAEMTRYYQNIDITIAKKFMKKVDIKI